MFEIVLDLGSLPVKIKSVIDNTTTIIDIDYSIDRPKEIETLELEKVKIIYKGFRIADESNFNGEKKSHITKVIEDNYVDSIISFLRQYYSTRTVNFFTYDEYKSIN